MHLTYNGKSTDTLLSVPLLPCHFNTPGEFSGFAREIQKGETTTTRPVANYYGTIYTEPLKFEFSLIKKDGSTFHTYEQRLVNKWLTSPKTPKWLEHSYDSNPPVLYRGLFQELKWKTGNNGIIGVSCSFESDSPYTWQEYSAIFSSTGTQTHTIFVDSDEEEEYVYPTFTITGDFRQDSNDQTQPNLSAANESPPQSPEQLQDPSTPQSPSDRPHIILTNLTDSNNSMKIPHLSALNLTFDCKRCIPSDATTNGIISYKDLGWEDVGSIYWLRLLPGKNQLQLTGNASIKLTYLCPIKKVGGYI